ncbi:MAG: hypothetical protein RMK51_08070 [Meiothermus sp.]|uniref:hypothetical protein n=1 Tax=Meiothermus sp. TaxID=1955249 RepID=UPI0025DA9271|nr:hypothetical protein [Meiothermus sp.]MCS7067679.1 hypothetical protein [Meiothermus sp.]MDW8425876.1 hypothetical protein [Meiothermus sp.]
MSRAMGLVFLLLLGFAEEGRQGGLVYTVPSGWQQVRQGAYTLLLPPDFSEERKLAIVITEGTVLKGDFQTTFEQVLREALASNEELVRSSPLQKERTTEGLEVLMKLLEVREKGGGNPTVRLYMALKAGNRMEVLVIMASQAQLFREYEGAIATFTDSLRLSNPSSAPQATTLPPSSTPIEGLYVANILRMRANTYGPGYTYTSFNAFWLFLSGGRLYFGLPPGDPTRLDYEKARREEPERVGSYRMVGNQVQFTFRGTAVAFTRGAATVRLGALWPGQTGPTVFRRVESCDGCRLNGVYVRRSFTDLTSPLGSGNVSGEVRFRFGPDGRFEVQGFTGFAVVGEAAGVAGSQRTGGQGSYRIQNNRLELTYSDGRREQAFFFRFPGEEEDVISINGFNYLRQR